MIARALRKSGGNVRAAAKALGYHRNAIYRRLSNSPRLQQVLYEQRDQMVNLAESGLRKLLCKTEPDLPAITFTLRTLGKKHGYIDRTEYDHSVGLNIGGREPDDVMRELIQEIIKTLKVED